MKVGCSVPGLMGRRIWRECRSQGSRCHPLPSVCGHRDCRMSSNSKQRRGYQGLPRSKVSEGEGSRMVPERSSSEGAKSVCMVSWKSLKNSPNSRIPAATLPTDTARWALMTNDHIRPHDAVDWQAEDCKTQQECVEKQRTKHKIGKPGEGVSSAGECWLSTYCSVNGGMGDRATRTEYFFKIFCLERGWWNFFSYKHSGKLSMIVKMSAAYMGCLFVGLSTWHKLGSSGKRESQLRIGLHKTGPWACVCVRGGGGAFS